MDNKSTKLANKIFPDIPEEESDVLNIPAEKRKLNTCNRQLVIHNF